MLDDSTLGPRILSNPAQLQYALLTDAQNRILGGTSPAPTANNGFNLLLDMSASTTAQFTKQEDLKFEALYLVRSVFSKEVYPALSDFDYINLTATPAQLDFQLILDKDWIIANAVPYDSNFNRLVIPDTTVVNLAGRTFGMYYPIEFLVNNTNQVVTVNYDITSINPLMTYASNMVSNEVTYQSDNINFYRFVFSMYQFTRSSTVDVVSKTNGYSKVISYTDNFYAARVYTYISGAWVELTYALSQMAYDVKTPTAILTPMPDTSSVRVDIPQVYFTTNMMGSQIRVDLYTTEGAINTTIAQNDVTNLTFSFDTSSTKYAAPFDSAPTKIITPYNTTILEGGKDAMDFNTLREQAINGSLYGQVPITPNELTDKISAYGYSSYKYLDNITDRIYFYGAALAYATDGSQVPTVVSGILLNSDNTTGNPSSILAFTDSTVTILPTTLFKFVQESNLSQPLSNSELAYLQALSSDDLATELNNQTYTRQPFHIVLSQNSKYPAAKSYNLMDPKMTNLSFVRENSHSSARITIVDSTIEHLSSGTGGFLIKFGVQYTAALASTPKTDQRLFLVVNDRSGVQVYIEATYLNSTSSLDVYSAVLTTNYQMTLDGYIKTTLPNTMGNFVQVELPLSCTFDAMTCVLQSDFPTIAQDSYLISYLPQNLKEDWLVTARQRITLQFGEDLSDMLFNSVNTTWGNQVYATYPNDIYYTYGKDQYLHDANGVIVSRTFIDSTGAKKLELVKTHASTDNQLSGGSVVLTITQSQSTPTATIAVDHVDGVLVGANVMGTSIPAGTKVQSIDATNLLVTLTNTPTAVTAKVTVTVQSGDTFTYTTAAQSAIGNQLTLSDTTNVVPGMTIMGFDVGVNNTNTIHSVSGQTVTLTANTNAIVPQNASVEVFNPAGPYLKQHSAGEVQYDALGVAMEIESATNTYTIQAPQFDARLYASSDAADQNYVASLTNTLVANAHALDTVRDTILERTYLYYKPYRTLGTATFGIGNGQIANLQLNISLSITYYVKSAVFNDATLKAEITANTLTALNSYIQNNTTIATSIISDNLTSQFSSNIVSLDISGFYNSEKYKTLALLDKDVALSVAKVLEVDPDGNLYLAPDIPITFVLDPSDTTSTTV